MTSTHSFDGTWIANIGKSQRHANHQFHSATLRFEVSGNTVTLIHGGINAAGNEEAGRSVLEADGCEYEVPQAPGVVVVTRWVGPRVLESEGRMNGRTAGKGTYEVSDDGATLTATVAGIDASGAPFEQVIVFDRM
jgi:hypothetical protein